MNLPEDLRRQIEAIAADSRSGALELLKRGAEVLLELLLRGAGRETVQEAAHSLMAAQPSMAPLIKLGWTIGRAAEEGLEEEELLERTRQFLREAESAPRLIAEAAAPLLRQRRVLTLSFSSAVIEALRAGTPLEVLCAESRPLCEGVDTARALASRGIKVRLGVDALIIGRVKEVDLVVVGADAVTVRGVVNKVGTYPLAVMAQREGKPFYVLAGAEKVLPPELEGFFRIEGKPSKEVAQVEGVEVENLYFDVTPLDLITAIVTPAGIFPPEEALFAL